MDNRVFDINGRGEAMLEAAVALACHQSGRCYSDSENRWGTFKGTGLIRSWRKDPVCGLILSWHEETDDGFTPLPAAMTPSQVLPMLVEYLASDEAEACIQNAWERKRANAKWCSRYDGGDVLNDAGWQVYVEDWGHVAHVHHAICAVRKAYLWYGK